MVPSCQRISPTGSRSAPTPSASPTRLHDPPPSNKRIVVVWLIAAIALASLNLRPAVVAIGPLAEDIRADTGLNAGAIGLLTTLPVVCFGAFALAAPRLARRLSLERAVLAALVLLVSGVALRLLSPIAALSSVR